MKNLTKLILPLAFTSALALNSIDSKAQDFLPGKFRNYSERKVLMGFYIDPIKEANDVFVKTSLYDIDGDSIPEVVELSLLKIENGALWATKNPYAYGLNLDPESECLKMFYDPQMDGWNGNEEILPCKEDSAGPGNFL